MKERMTFECICPGRRSGVCPMDKGTGCTEEADYNCYGISCRHLKYRRHRGDDAL